MIAVSQLPAWALLLNCMGSTIQHSCSKSFLDLGMPFADEIPISEAGQEILRNLPTKNDSAREPTPAIARLVPKMDHPRNMLPRMLARVKILQRSDELIRTVCRIRGWCLRRRQLLLNPRSLSFHCLVETACADHSPRIACAGRSWADARQHASAEKSESKTIMKLQCCLETVESCSGAVATRLCRPGHQNNSMGKACLHKLVN